ncbi:MAG TPA: FAD-binding oxidoreductase [Candidatus Acidoferrum sp.]|nr:FAD-binding oxidoreductase [Candidatus Acidoferrum sp.]
MNKVASYLQEHVAGEVVDSAAVRQHFAHDGSVLEVTPSMVVYPTSTNDIRKVARFTWQLAEKGHVLPLTARGLGGNQVGSAIGKGIILSLPTHMHHILELDIKQRMARVQPGVNFASFQTAIETHDLSLPAYPPSANLATIGGAIADNATGEKSIKYGSMRRYVDSLEVVLANGELIQTSRISKRELNRRKGVTSFEGEIYRQIDNLITDNWDLLQQYAAQPGASDLSTGYALSEVKRKDGSFDLTPLFVGSEGTLGIISEAILKLEPLAPCPSLITAYFKDLQLTCAAVKELQALQPSMLELVDKNLLDFVARTNPARLKGLVEAPFPAAVLFIEFDDEHKQDAKTKKAKKILAKYCESYAQAKDNEERDRLWSIRRYTTELLTADSEGEALPILSSGSVPCDMLQEFLEAVQLLFTKHHLKPALAGHVGRANLHIQPLLDLSKLGDRQKVFKLMDEYCDLVLTLGGDLNGDGGDGRLYAPYLPQAFGQDLYQIFADVQHIFDPYGTLNTGVKVGSSKEAIAPMLRKNYSYERAYDFIA